MSKDTITISMPVYSQVEDVTIDFRASVSMPVQKDVKAMIDFAVNSLVEQWETAIRDEAKKIVTQRVTKTFKDGGWL